MDAPARGIRRRLVFDATPSLVARFNEMVDRSSPESCWPWTGATRDGYGAIGHQGRVLGAHCVAFVIAHGSIPNGMLVLHSCDNRLCCNPSHLDAGTHSQNMRDMIARGGREMRGDNAPSVTITSEDARLIKAARVATGYGTARLAVMLPYSRHVIKHIIERTSWTHLPWPTPEEAAIAMRDARFASLPEVTP